ncbi:MAG: HAMP domain-containing histidine kinase [Clostridia bacterium]|nr:HAMP domain-containing histidine kinase [Clostridia bacterium]
MKAFTQNLAVKIISFLLCVLLVFFLFFSVIGVYLMFENDVYYDGGEGLKEQIYNSYSEKYYAAVEDMLHIKLTEGVDAEWFKERFDPQNTNFRYEAIGESGNVYASNMSDDLPTVAVREAKIKVFISTDGVEQWHYARLSAESGGDAAYEYIHKFEQNGDKYVTSHELSTDSSGILLKLKYREGSYDYVTVKSSVLKTPVKKDILYFGLQLADFAIEIRETIFIYMIIAGVLLIFLLIVLICGAGHKKGVDGIYISKFNKIPLDLYLALNCILAFVAIEVYCDIAYSDFEAIVGLCILVPLFTSMLLGIVVSFSARIKSETWHKYTVVYFVLKYLFIGIRAIFRWTVYFISKIPLFYKTLLVILLLTFLEILFLLFGLNEYLLLWVIEKIVITPFVIYCVLCMRKLQTSARKLAQGDTGYKTDTGYMLFDFKEHGENLNGISNGLELAVEENVRSERMKTELITNVSHDIKTPLTSVINYVDLLKKEGLDSKNAPEYLSIIDKHSARLKRLTEDLVEASKASTGNVRINYDNTNINVLLNQTVGEFEEKLAEKRLSLVIDVPEEELVVRADGRHLWRVFDNLMNNICKYSMPDTRVYISAQKADERVKVVFKNISREELNIMPSELTERFVRGDKSRNTEGSGLGLSIAKSLVELQGGIFEIHIDGDLFKVTVTI